VTADIAMNDRTTIARRNRRTRKRPAGLIALAVLALALPFGSANSTVTIQEGLVSWYGEQFHDRPTASGELFDASAMTMAHPTLPFGTQVKVTNLRNGRSVVLRVNDRGPFVGRRIADLSQAAASTLGMLRRGIAHARLEVLHSAD
jgi:rare lipoprotein A (peptidoglycan hydrolase)